MIKFLKKNQGKKNSCQHGLTRSTCHPQHMIRIKKTRLPKKKT